MFSQLALYFTDCSCRVGKLKIELGSLTKIPFHTLSVCWFYESNQAGFSFVCMTSESVQSQSIDTTKWGFPHAKK